MSRPLRFWPPRNAHMRSGPAGPYVRYEDYADVCGQLDEANRLINGPLDVLLEWRKRMAIAHDHLKQILKEPSDA